ncbi:acetate--CoA ligase family protein [Pseudomaricurvus alkylphenolicus]|uniref:acetate--CoA ligase family protein n=1 Tax=Pseudomaricurvus alkylphenolicus TaxID=1306991 RepID=UPI0014224E13|nr:acetate--CoA ligase family protein [Pseudomaricurvus alkylphenolicus]NIB42187.1 acetate--CoA ligase family protein [Pseudomaricurvus alkylphenolicus]
MASCDKIKRLLNPQHIAFVGGSNMASAVKRCRASGFEGEVWLVNPKHKSIDGERCFATVKDLPQAPDASFIGVGREATVNIVRDLNKQGAAGAICYASGFSEAGEEGEVLQHQLLQAAGEMALIGPNCYGMLDYLHGAALWPVAHGGTRVDKGVAILTQSGNFAYNLSMTDRSLPVSYMVSVGNQASVEVADLIDALLDEPRVTAIGLHLEGLKNVAGFAAAAMRALQKGVPIIALKTGRSSIGAELALSHTSSLAGSDELYDSLFDRVGVIRVSGPVSFVETLKVLAQGKLPQGNKVAALACSGGDAGLIADYCESNQLALPPLQAEQTRTLTQLLPDFANVANPLDFTTAIWGDENALNACADAMLAGDCDAGFLVLDYPAEQTGERAECDLMARVFQRALEKRGIPGAVASVFPELLPSSAREMLHQLGIPALQGVEEGLAAMGRAVQYVRRRRALLSLGKSSKLLPIAAPSLTQEAQLMDEWQSKKTLAAYGLPVPQGQLVHHSEAVAAAELMAYPVVVKVVSSELPHKTEAGAVSLNLSSADAVAAAVEEMVTNVKLSAPHVDTERVLVEKMSQPPVAELIVGVKREPGFGLALVIGSGGILVELLQDSVNLLLPTTEAEITASLERLKVYKVMSGFRGKPAGDIQATVAAIMAVANYAVDNAEHLAELDVNPLLVLPEGEGAVAVDALIRTTAEM